MLHREISGSWLEGPYVKNTIGTATTVTRDEVRGVAATFQMEKSNTKLRSYFRTSMNEEYSTGSNSRSGSKFSDPRDYVKYLRVGK